MHSSQLPRRIEATCRMIRCAHSQPCVIAGRRLAALCAHQGAGMSMQEMCARPRSSSSVQRRDANVIVWLRRPRHVGLRSNPMCATATKRAVHMG